MPALSIKVDEDFNLQPVAKRVVIKAITNRDELDQLYCVLKDSLKEGNTIVVEVWENIKREVSDDPNLLYMF